MRSTVKSYKLTWIGGLKRVHGATCSRATDYYFSYFLFYFFSLTYCLSPLIFFLSSYVNTNAILTPTNVPMT